MRVTTFQALRNLQPLAPGLSLAMLTVDEAHYAKNPDAQRTKAVQAWAAATRRVVFLTGTPTENRRAHRMGQVRRVDVHRLLSEDGVDARILEITQAKRAEFDEYARRSDLAASTPDAIYIADLDTVKEVASQAEQERRILEAERKRLRLEAQGD